MSAETQINAALLADGPVTAVVGSGSVARIYPDFLAQEIILPGLVNQRAETEYVNTIHTGAAVASRIIMETWCLAETRIAAEQLADLVEPALTAAEFRIVGRRPEYDQDTLTYATVVSSEVWPE